VIDTNVFVAAMRSEGGLSREVIRRAIRGEIEPLFSNALWLEYEAVLGRPIWTDVTSEAERRNVLDAIAAAGRWVKVYFGWRPNLRDPGDDHLVELAVAGGAQAIITHNIRDVQSGELKWQSLTVLTPRAFLEQLS